jgi:hypothetical protein
VNITAYFSKEMPLNPDSSLGPVVIGSKIRVEKGEPLPLQEGRVEFVPGQAWDPRYLSITKEMTPERKKLNIHVGLAGTVPISVYASLILKQQPITLRVTLIPAMAVPGMGIPVAVPLAPFIDEVSITIPPIPQPEMILEGTYPGKAGDGKERAQLTATVMLPPYISPSEKEDLIRNISFEVTDVRNGTITPGGNSSDKTKKTMELIAIPNPASPGGPLTATVRSSVSFHDLVLAGEKRLSFECGKTFILNISPGTLDVTMDRKGSFTARVLEEREGQYYPATDASLSVEVGPEVAKILKVSPTWGQNELSCTATQTGFSTVKSADLIVTAKADDGEIQSGTIKVNLARESIGELVIVFDPESKNSVSPFIRGDSVTLKAKVVPPFGEPPVHASIEFACANPKGWLVGTKDTTTIAGSIAGPTADISRLPAQDDEGWESAVFMGNNPVPAVQGIPPAMEPVIVTAKKDGVVIGRDVIQVGILGRSMLSVDKEKINFLANADTPREGRPAPITTEKVTVTVLNPGIYTWNIRMEPTGDTQFISQKEISRTSTSAVYEFTLKDRVPLPENRPGKPGWEQQVNVHTYANLATAGKLGEVETQPDVMVQGPDILIRILHEGLFVEATYEYDEQGVRHEIVGKKDLVIRVGVPSGKPYKPPEIKIVALIWDGQDMAPNSRVFIDHVREPQESKDRDRKARAMWKTLFFDMKGSVSIEFKKKEEFRTTGGDYYPPAIWEVFVSTSIPAFGERLRGHILFFAKKQADGDLHPDEAYTPKFGSMVSAVPAMSFVPDTTWQLEVPVELIFGIPGEIVTEDNIRSLIDEMARCNEIIDTSFPPERRQKLRDQLDELRKKGAGAPDYRKFSESLYTQAHEVWAEDNASYLRWESFWSGSIWALDNTVVAGDIAFQVLVAYATSELGPWASYFTEKIATSLKEESLKFYLFYAKRGGAIDEAAQAYVEKEWIEFLQESLDGAVETIILRDFTIERVVKDPKKSLRTVTWLWIWKFGLNYHKDPKGGYYKAMKAAAIDIGDVLLVKAIEHYVKKQGNKDIKKLFRKAQDLGFFGGTIILGATRPEEEGKIPPGQKPGKTGRRTDTSGGDEYHPSGTPLGPEYRTFTYKDAPGADVDKLTKGMTADHKTAAQRISTEENVDLLIRSTTPYAEELIRTGQADPKPEYVKTKTINEIDLKLFPSLTKEDLGKVGYFQPNEPAKPMPEKGTVSDAEYKQLEAEWSRYKQRAQEFKDQETHINQHQNLDPASGEKIVVENGKVKKVLPDGTTKDISGDYDVFGVLDGTTGQPLTDPERMERVYSRLKNEMNVQHPWQSQWDYRDESRVVPSGKGAQSDYEIKKGIDQKIINSHTEGKEGAEPLIKFSPDGTTSGSWIAGVSEP